MSIEERAELLSALSDPIRLKVIDLLAAGTMCVCDLQESIAVAPNLLSYHLRVLREAGLVEASRRGRWVDYRMAPDAPVLLSAALPRQLRDSVPS